MINRLFKVAVIILALIGALEVVMDTYRDLTRDEPITRVRPMRPSRARP